MWTRRRRTIRGRTRFGAQLRGAVSTCVRHAKRVKQQQKTKAEEVKGREDPIKSELGAEIRWLTQARRVTGVQAWRAGCSHGGSDPQATVFEGALPRPIPRRRAAGASPLAWARGSKICLHDRVFRNSLSCEKHTSAYNVLCRVTSNLNSFKILSTQSQSISTTIPTGPYI